jgi:hypothetical protein
MTGPIDSIITHIADSLEARNLPCGAMIGDTCGGRSFNDNSSYVLESRSLAGWQEIHQDQQEWTVIVLNR